MKNYIIRGLTGVPIPLRTMKIMVGARGVEPLTSTVSGHFRGDAMFPLCFLLATVVYVFVVNTQTIIPDVSEFHRMSTIQKLYKSTR